MAGLWDWDHWFIGVCMLLVLWWLVAMTKSCVGHIYPPNKWCIMQSTPETGPRYTYLVNKYPIQIIQALGHHLLASNTSMIEEAYCSSQ